MERMSLRYLRTATMKMRLNGSNAQRNCGADESVLTVRLVWICNGYFCDRMSE